MPLEVKIQRHQVIFRVHHARPYIVRTLVALHERNLRLRMFVVVIVMPVIESVTFVITESVVFHHLTHPFQICDEHVLHFRHVVTPVAGTVPVLTVIFITRSRTPAGTRTRCRIRSRRFVPLRIHLIVLAYIRSIRMEDAELTKVHLWEVAPRRPTRTVVDHDIGDHLTVIGMQRIDQGLQLGTCTPVRVLVRVVLRVITRTVAVRTRR